MRRVFFTCMREHLKLLESGKFSLDGYLETYPLVELAMLNKHPGDDCLVELHLPDSYSSVETHILVSFSEFSKEKEEIIYRSTSIKLWEKYYAEQCNNGKFDTMYLLKTLESNPLIKRRYGL